MSSNRSVRSADTPLSHAHRAFRKIRDAEQADVNDVNITLFLNDADETCGWFIGPLSFGEGRVTMPYLPATDETRATLAVIRALDVAILHKHTVCLIDPEDLWDTIWES